MQVRKCQLRALAALSEVSEALHQSGVPEALHQSEVPEALHQSEVSEALHQSEVSEALHQSEALRQSRSPLCKPGTQPPRGAQVPQQPLAFVRGLLTEAGGHVKGRAEALRCLGRALRAAIGAAGVAPATGAQGGACGGALGSGGGSNGNMGLAGLQAGAPPDAVATLEDFLAEVGGSTARWLRVLGRGGFHVS